MIKKQLHVMLELHNMRIEPLTARKKKRITKCDNSTITCHFGTASCEYKTVKCEKKGNHKM